jgi:hypothetical protein
MSPRANHTPIRAPGVADKIVILNYRDETPARRHYNFCEPTAAHLGYSSGHGVLDAQGL